MELIEKINALCSQCEDVLKSCCSDEILEDSKDLALRAQRTDSFVQVSNLMGRYASYHYYAQHLYTYEFFTKNGRATAELGSTGVYADLDKIYAMFLIYHNHYNMPGTAHCHPLTTPYIIVSGDGKTAKTFMYTPGYEILPTDGDAPQFNMWFYDAYDIDFIQEDGQWKWLRFHLADDIKSPFYVSLGILGKQEGPHPDGLVPPSYYNEQSFTPYSYHRKPSLSANFPEPYYTYDEDTKGEV